MTAPNNLRETKKGYKEVPKQDEESDHKKERLSASLIPTLTKQKGFRPFKQETALGEVVYRLTDLMSTIYNDCKGNNQRVQLKSKIQPHIIPIVLTLIESRTQAEIDFITLTALCEKTGTKRITENR